METLKLVSITHLTGRNNIIVRALNVSTMEKRVLHVRPEELQFFNRVFDTGELFKLDENSIVYTNNCKQITNT